MVEVSLQIININYNSIPDFCKKGNHEFIMADLD